MKIKKTQPFSSYKVIVTVIIVLLCSHAQAKTVVNFYYIQGSSEQTVELKIIRYALTQLPNYKLNPFSASSKRMNKNISKSRQHGIYCSVEPQSVRDDFDSENVIWSRVIVLSPTEWVVAYNKNISTKMQKYITTDGYFIDDIGQLDFTTADLPSPFMAIFRDPSLSAGYPYEFPKETPADIIANTRLIRSQQGHFNVLRMIDKGRLDVTATSFYVFKAAIEQWQLANIAHLQLEFTRDGDHFDLPFWQLAVRCSRNQDAEMFITELNQSLIKYRGTEEFVHHTMEGVSEPRAVNKTLKFSQKLRKGWYDRSSLSYSPYCSVLKTFVDQSKHNGQWNVIATVSDPVAVIIRGDRAGYTDADAVKFTSLTSSIPVETIVDNSHSDYSHSGMGYTTSRRSGSYNNSFNSGVALSSSSGKWAKWSTPVDLPGQVEVSMWWPSAHELNPVKNAPVEIAYGENCAVTQIYDE